YVPVPPTITSENLEALKLNSPSPTIWPSLSWYDALQKAFLSKPYWQMNCAVPTWVLIAGVLYSLNVNTARSPANGPTPVSFVADVESLKFPNGLLPLPRSRSSSWFRNCSCVAIEYIVTFVAGLFAADAAEAATSVAPTHAASARSGTDQAT